MSDQFNQSYVNSAPPPASRPEPANAASQPIEKPAPLSAAPFDLSALVSGIAGQRAQTPRPSQELSLAQSALALANQLTGVLRTSLEQDRARIARLELQVSALKSALARQGTAHEPEQGTESPGIQSEGEASILVDND